MSDEAAGRDGSSAGSREARPDSRVRRWLARTGLVAVGLASLGGSLVYGLSEWRLERRHALPDPPGSLRIPVDRDLVDRGRHLVTIVAQCTHCHGPDLAGRAMVDDPWIGRLHASNLTRGQGGVGARFTDADWVAALRDGLGPEGRSLLLMPSVHLSRLSDRDLAAIVAYARQVPPVDRVLPERRTGWLTRLVVALGLAPDLISAEQIDRRAPGGDVIAAAASPEYGEYLVALGGCRVCHRADLAGGLHPLSLPGEPVPPDLRPSGPLGRWSREDFARAMREGRTPDGRTLDREFMPWPAFAGLRDVELEAIWRYLGTLDAQPDRAGEAWTELASGSGTASKGS